MWKEFEQFNDDDDDYSDCYDKDVETDIAEGSEPKSNINAPNKSESDKVK